MLEITEMVSDGAGQTAPPWLSPMYDLAIVGSTVTASLSASVLACADARLGYSRQVSKIVCEAYGAASPLFESSGVLGDVVGGSAVRIARVVDPDDGSKFAWLMRCTKTDPDTASTNAKRAEFSYAKNTVPYGRWTTAGFMFRQQSYPSHTDDWLIAQIHAGVSSSLVNPWLAFYYKNDALRVDCRYNNAVQQSVSLPHLYGAWNSVVVESNLDAISGRVKVWLNGSLRMDYTGLLAEETQRSDGFWKSGLYEWEAPTQWDDLFPVREIYMKGLYIFTGQQEAAMHTLLAEI